MHFTDMDEVDADDVTVGSQIENFRANGKECENLVESCNILEPLRRITNNEGDSHRSSIQQFVDILGGKDPNIVVNVVDTPQEPCTSYFDGGEGRVQELTIGEYEVMDKFLNERQHGNQPGLGLEIDASKEPLINKERALSLANDGHLLNHNPLLKSGQPTFGESDAVLRHALSSGAMRMKIISRSSECPEYYVKSTLKGKGVLCKGPISPRAEVKVQRIVKAAVVPAEALSPLVNMGQNPVLPSNRGDPGVVGGESVNNGMNLRDWMKPRQINLWKVDRLCMFKLILDLVHSLHSDGKVLLDLRPSCFRLLSSGMVEYFGHLFPQNETHGGVMHKDLQKSQTLKRPLEQSMPPHFNLGTKHQKSIDYINFLKVKSQFQLGFGSKTITNAFDADLAGPGVSKTSSWLHFPPPAQQHMLSVNEQLEEKWYRSPEELVGRACTLSSNIHSLGVFFFELLSSFDSGKVLATAMSDLRHRIFSPNFLSQYPKEVGFCLWLLHPEPSLRPTARDVIQSEVVSEIQALCGSEKSSSIQEDEGESELLLHFLLTAKEQKQKYASKLVEDLGCIESDVKELEKRHQLKNSMTVACSAEEYLYQRQRGFLYHGDGVSIPAFNGRDSRFLKNVPQLESAYFSARSQINVPLNKSMVRTDRNVLKNRENWCLDQNDKENSKNLDGRGAFFDGLCKYARYSKLKVRGTLRNRDVTNSTNVVCSLSFDRDEDYFATAGGSKKIKIFDFHTLYDNYVDIHYPVIEMANKSKLSCVSWNNYIRNYLASTDNDGIVKLWDASSGQEFCQYIEHDKRAWSVDFSPLDPMKLASGSDDFSVKLWSINERNCLHTIWTNANVCCVQFSAHSSHLLAFGSADYKIYCYDLRNANAPWCVLDGHQKTVSYVKFVDSETLVSASTDNTLKLWDLSRSSPTGLSSNACSLTLGGHKNEKNFVGLAVADGYIACGSETNEVCTYYKSLPMPITKHKFGSIDPISGKETDDGNGHFVSSVCWKGNSNVMVAANSTGGMKVLEMV